MSLDSTVHPVDQTESKAEVFHANDISEFIASKYESVNLSYRIEGDMLAPVIAVTPAAETKAASEVIAPEGEIEPVHKLYYQAYPG